MILQIKKHLKNLSIKHRLRYDEKYDYHIVELIDFNIILQIGFIPINTIVHHFDTFDLVTKDIIKNLIGIERLKKIQYVKHKIEYVPKTFIENYINENKH
jgi:hypothetical protein